MHSALKNWELPRISYYSFSLLILLFNSLLPLPSHPIFSLSLSLSLLFFFFYFPPLPPSPSQSPLAPFRSSAPQQYLSGGRSSPKRSGENFVGKFVNLNFRTYLTFLNWMPQALRMSESEIISHAGLDSAVFLRIYILGYSSLLLHPSHHLSLFSSNTLKSLSLSLSLLYK